MARAGKVQIRDVPTRGKLAPMLEALDELEPKTSYRKNRVAKRNRVIGHINEETKPTSTVGQHLVSLNVKQQDHDFRSWLGQESIKDREAKQVKERKARSVKVQDWLDF